MKKVIVGRIVEDPKNEGEYIVVDELKYNKTFDCYTKPYC